LNGHVTAGRKPAPRNDLTVPSGPGILHLMSEVTLILSAIEHGDPPAAARLWALADA
jgi:hypothetical protein